MNNKKQQLKMTVNPQIRFGKPTIPGTRIAIEDILRLIEAGYNIDEIPNEYPQITVNQARQALAYTASIQNLLKYK